MNIFTKIILLESIWFYDTVTKVFNDIKCLIILYNLISDPTSMVSASTKNSKRRHETVDFAKKSTRNARIQFPIIRRLNENRLRPKFIGEKQQFFEEIST